MAGARSTETPKPLPPEASADDFECLEIEKRLVGWLLADSPGASGWLADVYERSSSFAPLLARVVENIALAPQNGIRLVSAASIALQMADDADLQALGGKKWLASLALEAPAEANPVRGSARIGDDLERHRKLTARAGVRRCIEAAHTALAEGAPDAFAQLTDLPALLAAAGDDRSHTIQAAAFVWREPQAIPTREWLYGHHLIRKFASATIAPGGVGKTTLGIAEEIAMAAHRPFLGVSVPRPLRVWSWNLEDPAEETERRIHAVCLHHNITERDLGGRLFVSSGRDQPCVIARSDRNGTFIVQPVIERIVAEIIAKKIDVLRIDPFVSCHEVAENDNTAIEMVAKEWARVADRANCAVELVHHSRKVGDAEVTADASRGASALVNACRSVRVINRMTKEEAERAGVDQARLHFRVLTDKLNLAPPAEKSDWYRLESISLGNGPPSDHVGVVVPWTWPDAFDGIAPGTLFAVQKRIADGEWKESGQAKNWAGIAVAEVLELDPTDPKHKTRCRTLLKSWLASGALVVNRKLDESRHERPFIEVGQWEAQ